MALTAKEKLLIEKVASLSHTKLSELARYIIENGVECKDGSLKLAKGFSDKLKRKSITPYSKLRGVEKIPAKKTAERYINLIKNTKIGKQKADPRVNKLINTFKEYCSNIRNFTPEISYGVEGSMLKAKLKTYSEQDFEELFDWFLNNELSTKLGCSLKICLGNYVFNQWLRDRNKYDV